MTEYEMLKKRTIKLLGEIISSESAKPDDEADFALIEECENLLCELLDADISLSEEDIDARIKKITQKNSKILFGKTKKRISRVVAIACASIVLCIGVGAAACMIDPKILDGICTILKYNVGESIDIGGITFTNGGKVKEYKTIDELLADNQIDIMYPHELPEGVYIEDVYVSEDGLFPIEIVLSSNGMVCIYNTDFEKFEDLKAISEGVEVNGNLFYVKQTHEQWSALAYDDLYMYHITCSSREDLQIIMEGLER